VPQGRQLRGVVGQAALPVLCIASVLRPDPQQAVLDLRVRFLTLGTGKAACPTLARTMTMEAIRGLCQIPPCVKKVARPSRWQRKLLLRHELM
jgi:hypothetical protein